MAAVNNNADHVEITVNEENIESISNTESSAGRRSRRNSDVTSNRNRTGSRSRNTSIDRSPRRNRRDTESAMNDAIPLLPSEAETNLPRQRPPLAGPELDEDDLPEEDPTYNPNDNSGIDDGFLTPSFHGKTPDTTDAIDRPGVNGGVPRRRGSVPPVFPYAPEYGPGVFQVGGESPRIIPDVNVYQQKKTLAQGMMDLALLSANANQLRYVLESYSRHPYFYFSATFISLSLIIQIAVGIGLILNSRYDVKDQDDICRADRINNWTVIGIFMITVVNVLISAFGVAEIPQAQTIT